MASRVVAYLARGVWLATMVLTPLFGFWLASSLTAYKNATQWLALLVGLLLFPLLPFAWEASSGWRRKRQPAPRKPALTRLDRLVLRTLLINGLFLAVTLYTSRATAFRALAVRGDWMFDGYDGPVATTFRSWLLAFADQLDTRRVDDHGYGKSDEAPDVPTPTPTPSPTPTPAKDPMAWPLAVAPDPLVAEMPEANQTSIDEVGKYLAARFTDQRLLVKAIHDYVVLRMSYDDDALALILKHDYANTPPQDAESVFTRRRAVCEGYARLMVALGKAAGVEIAYVTGWIRDAHRRLSLDETGQPDLDGVSHAWNAVKLDGHWQLVDATWDDPTTGDATTTYLFTPPALMTYDHLPEDPAWQLRADPISLGDFVRQPLMSPSIGGYGLALAAPLRSQISVDGDAEIILDNPQDARISAVARRDGEKTGKGERCRVGTTGSDKRTRITCALPSGEWEVQMFAAHERDTHAGRYSLAYVGSILVNSR